MAICYLEIDDEITGAVARMRAIDDGEAVLMVPPGSKIGTSRINFRLLAREAADRGLALVAVSDEPNVRQLAVSAGVPAYDSLDGAQAALAELRAARPASLRDPARSARPRAMPPPVTPPVSPHATPAPALMSPPPPEPLAGRPTADELSLIHI